MWGGLENNNRNTQNECFCIMINYKITISSTLEATARHLFIFQLNHELFFHESDCFILNKCLAVASSVDEIVIL